MLVSLNGIAPLMAGCWELLCAYWLGVSDEKILLNAVQTRVGIEATRVDATRFDEVHGGITELADKSL